MSDSFEKLRQTVFAELKKQTQQINNQAQETIPFGAFLEACLVNRGKSRNTFAQELGIELELADAILDGLLPPSEIKDDFLIEIAHVVRYDPNLLRIILKTPESSHLNTKEV